MKGYVFVSNSNKPSKEEAESRTISILNNVNRPCLQTALDKGYDVYLGINRDNPEGLECELPIHLYDSHTYRSITAFKDNKIAFENLSQIIKDGNIKVIHCNTPVGGMIGRLCGRKYHVNKVIYTAHGFHFYNGAPLFNRTILKWAEHIMAHWTDSIITMNQEDYEAAKKFKLKKDGKVYFVHGVGINLNDFDGIDVYRKEKRIELNLKEDDISLISAGDLILRKNYGIAIRAIAKNKNPRLHYFICGEGPEEKNLKALAKELMIENQIHFLGFRTDVKELMAASDIFLFTTLQEGMPRSLMEAMACGLACIVSKVRGNVDLIKDGVGGYLCSSTDSNAFAEAISKVAEDKKLRDKMTENNLERIKEYDVLVVEKEISDIYEEVLSSKSEC